MVQIKHDCKIIFWSINVKKVVLILCTLILVSCSDPSCIDCNPSYVSNQFWKGFLSILSVGTVISSLFTIIYNNIKNKNKDIDLQLYVLIFICILIVLAIVWAIAVVWFN